MGRALCRAMSRERIPFAVLSRRPDRARRLVPGARVYRLWQPIERGSPWATMMETARAVVHLASPLTGPGRWNHAHRQELYEGCVVGTRCVVSAVAQARSRPEVLICASSTAFYARDRTGECRYTLPRLWWAASLGMGGAPRPGSQRQPWVHVDDVVGLVMQALGDGRLAGALNVVAPHSVTGAEFMGAVRTLGRMVSGVPQPKWWLRSPLGAGAVMVTNGRGAVAARALELGYQFRQPRLHAALRHALGRGTAQRD